MGMGIMRVGVEGLENIHCRMYWLASITGTEACSMNRQWTVATGHLALLAAPVVTI